MMVFRGFDDLPQIKFPVVTVGSYDGVHAGHRVLLGEVVRRAKAIGGESVVVTFAPHPRAVLGNRNEPVMLLNSLAEKEILLRDVGIDNLIVVEFTTDFSRISSRDFVRDYIVGRLGAKIMVVGYNHHFGHNKEGDFAYLQSLRDDLGLDVVRVDAYDFGEDKVSSTVIRHLVAEGKMKQAAKYLTRPYFVIASVDSHGHAHVDDPNKLLPPDGTYEVEILGATCEMKIENRILKSGCFTRDSECVVLFK